MWEDDKRPSACEVNTQRVVVPVIKDDARKMGQMEADMRCGDP